MRFEEITAVSCWLDFALDVGVDLDADQRSEGGRSLHPRLWKSHQRLAAINPGCKHIVTLRRPDKVAASYYHFYESKGLTQGLSIDEWTRKWASDEGATWSGPLWPYIIDYFERRDDPNVLIVQFEELQADPRSQVRRIASFIGAPCDAALLETVLELSSSTFMARYPEKFDDHWLHEKQLSRGSFGQFPLGMAAKVSLPQSQKLSADVLAHLQERWQTCVEPKTGASSYEELCALLKHGLYTVDGNPKGRPGSHVIPVPVPSPKPHNVAQGFDKGIKRVLS